MSILSWLYKTIDPDHIPAELTASENQDVFHLRIGELVIGQLSVENEQWRFVYSNEFRDQDRYRRIVGFSDLERVYLNDELWPFFRMRIPGLKQPKVQEILEQENIDSKDVLSLLKRFGRQSISNPYTLEPA